MAQILWSQSDLIQELKKGKPFDYIHIEIKFFINNTEILGGPATFIYLFFLQLFGSLQWLDSHRLGEFNFQIEPRNEVTGEGFLFRILTNETNPNTLEIEYQRTDMVGEFRHISIPFDQFVQGMIESCRNYVNEVVQLKPELRLDPDMILLEKDMQIIDTWYHARWGS